MFLISWKRNRKIITLITGFATDDRCSCKLEPETLNHLFFNCMHSTGFCKEFESYFHSLTNEFICITLQGVLLGVITSVCPLLNYLLLTAKIYIWDCRRTHTSPNINGFKLKVKTKYETEKYIYIKNSKLDKFNKKRFFRHFISKMSSFVSSSLDVVSRYCNLLYCNYCILSSE